MFVLVKRLSPDRWYASIAGDEAAISIIRYVICVGVVVNMKYETSLVYGHMCACRRLWVMRGDEARWQTKCPLDIYPSRDLNSGTRSQWPLALPVRLWRPEWGELSGSTGCWQSTVQWCWYICIRVVSGMFHVIDLGYVDKGNTYWYVCLFISNLRPCHNINEHYLVETLQIQCNNGYGIIYFLIGSGEGLICKLRGILRYVVNVDNVTSKLSL